VTSTVHDLYLRGSETSVSCWTEYARTSPNAAVHRLTVVDVAVFTEGPERDVFNNAILGHGLGGRARTEAVDAMVETYAAAGVSSYAAWVHESDAPMRRELTRRGFTIRETTWAMGLSLDDLPEKPPPVDLAPDDWATYLRVLGLPPGLLASTDPTAFHVVLGRLGDEPVAAAMAFDHADDCGVYNVATLEHARRRGFAGALTALQLHRARARGRRTATLQSTATARSVYAGVGFRDLGRILEFGPGTPS
jgi:hypothetical protein